jgi:hypothetical protein
MTTDEDAYDRFATRLAQLGREFWQSLTDWESIKWTLLFTAIYLVGYGAFKLIEGLLP